MELVKEARAKNLVAYSDSQLVVEQMNENYKAKKLSMVKYLGKVRHLKELLKGFKIK